MSVQFSKNLDFDIECQTLGVAFARAKLRLDEKAPPGFKTAYQSYRGLRAFPSYYERKCLSLRLSAAKRGMVLDHQIDADFLEAITPDLCPVTLETLETGEKSPSNPSADRIVNEGTYAAGNVAMFSIRANQAKGEKTFEEVISIATAGEPCRGLEPLEWMRLASLMYGAWSAAVPKGDPYLVPLATYPAPKTFASDSQVVQFMLLRHCRNEVWPASMNVWKQATVAGMGSERQFMEFTNALHAGVLTEDYPPTAWLHPGVFDGFVVWYKECVPAISALMNSLHGKYQNGVEPDAITELWMLGKRYVV